MSLHPQPSALSLKHHTQGSSIKLGIALAAIKVLFEYFKIVFKSLLTFVL